MTVRPFGWLSGDYWRIKSLYQTAFPPEECLPYFPLIWRSHRQGVSVYLYYDRGDFCGFSYLVEDQDQLFLLFLAVVPGKQGQGIGTAILAHMADLAAGRPIHLCIEPLQPEAENAQERQQRLAFYQRSGFEQTIYHYREGSEVYQVLSTDLDFSAPAFEALLTDFFKDWVDVSLFILTEFQK